MALPCGKCPNCKKRRISGWSFRLMKHAEIQNSAIFLTLTYNTDHVPITKNGFMSLDKTDIQKYFKRLRKLHDIREGGKAISKISYYCCGEYGTTTMRPHYHMLLFNAHLDDAVNAWKLEGKELGTYHVGQVSEASVGYTLKYMCKPTKIPLHKNDDRVPEFSLMSKGMGKNYLTDAMIQWHKRDLVGRVYVPLKDGKKIAMPRYYKDKMYTKLDKFFIGENASVLSQLSKKQLENQHGENLEQFKINQLKNANRKLENARLSESI